MSRRLNRDPLPLHKPEAYSTLLQWPDLRVEATYFLWFRGLLPRSLYENVMSWSLTYVATPIAVAVREALFTSSGLTNWCCIGALPSLLCTGSLCLARLVSTLPFGIVSTLSVGMRLLRLAHSIWDHSVLVLCFSARVSGLLAGGSLGSVAGFALVFLVAFVASQ